MLVSSLMADHVNSSSKMSVACRTSQESVKSLYMTLIYCPGLTYVQ